MEKENENVIHRTPLTRQACYTSCLELQKVGLVIKVFNKKTVSALSMDGKRDTATFIDHFLKLWKFLNCKNPDAHIRLNDPDRRPFESANDHRLEIMRATAESFEDNAGKCG